MVDVRLNVPVPIEGAEAVQNFTRSYYVVASSAEEALLLISQRVAHEGGQVLSADPVMPVERLPSDLIGRAAAPGRRGIVWQSGRAFYPAD